MDWSTYHDDWRFTASGFGFNNGPNSNHDSEIVKLPELEGWRLRWNANDTLRLTNNLRHLVHLLRPGPTSSVCGYVSGGGDVHLSAI